MCKTSPSCTRLIVLYRPPSHSKAEFLDEFRDYMDTHVTTAGRLLVVGDFNLHMDDKEDNDAIRFKELLHSLNLQQHITCPTHKQGHTLDLLITRSSDDLVSHPIVYASSMSDHCPITCKLHIETNEWFTRWKINFRFIHILLQSYYYNRSMYNRTVIYYILSLLTFLKVYTG